MLEKGFMATSSFYATYAHREPHITSYLEAVGEAFDSLAKAIEEGVVEDQLKGPVAHSGFQRLT
jgi:hypothetical protein